MATYNAVTFYGEAERWDDLERWGQRLIDLANAEPFRTDPAIRVHEVKAAANAILAYGKAGLHGTTRWRDRLALAARACPFDPQIQDVANSFGLTAATQFAQHRSQLT